MKIIAGLSKDCYELTEKLEKLRIKLAESKPGMGGGTFEWVDSILVTALQSGHWLLIDNVNFCRYTLVA
jgi:midasin